MSALNDLTLRILIGAKDNTKPGIKSVRAGVRSVSDELKRLETIATRFLSIRLFSGFLQDAIQLSDSYKSMAGRLQQVTNSSDELASIQQKLFDLSQQTLTPLQATVNLYARSAQALKNVSDGQSLALKLTQAVNASFRAQNSTTEEVQSTVIQLTQAIGTGTVTWEDFGNVAQSNLLLANIAAKNLGFDGIASLKKAISQGKVTGEAMTRAIVNGMDEINAAARSVPVSVSAAWTTLNNAILKYVGESDAAGSSTATLSAAIQGLAKHIDDLITAGLIVAQLFGVRVVSGLLQSGKAYIENAQAARQAAIAEQFEAQAQLQQLQIKAQVAAISAKAAFTLVQEARLQQALAATEIERTQAARALTIALEKQKIAQQQANAANRAAQSSITGVIPEVNRLGLAFKTVNAAITGLFALDIGVLIGNWVKRFEPARLLGARIAEGFVIAKTGIEDLFKGGVSSAERAKELNRIFAEFNAIAKNTTDVSLQAAEAEKRKTEIIKTEAAKQKIAFEKVQKAVTDLTKKIDDNAKLQTAIIQQQLTDQLQAIDSLNISQIERDKLRLQTRLEAFNEEIRIQQNSTNQKLALIDNEYGEERRLSTATTEQIKTQESEKKQAKLAVYQGLAAFYQGEINKLQSVFQTEVNAAREANDQIQSLEQTHQNALFDISLKGLTKRDALNKEKERFDQLARQAQQEAAKGEQSDQEKINLLLTEARRLNEKIRQAAGNSAKAKADDVNRENTLFEIQKGLLESNARAHEENAQRAKAALQNTKATLENIQTTITGITQQLSQELQLKIGIDQTSLTEAQSIITALTEPETKEITIVTTSGARQGGLIQKFSSGGFNAVSGQLPGFGGGDRVRALLEAGEFVIRKEAVRTYGAGLFATLNAMQTPVGTVIKRRFGGTVEPVRMQTGGAAPASAGGSAQINISTTQSLLDLIANNRTPTITVDINANIDAAKTNINRLLQTIRSRKVDFGLTAAIDDANKKMAALAQSADSIKIAPKIDRKSIDELKQAIESVPKRLNIDVAVSGDGSNLLDTLRRQGRIQ